ncbi:MAG: MFS transporter [Sulfolobaceae archaeon]|nr:MFS transporter [Sulfolobaceae archaeon]
MNKEQFFLVLSSSLFGILWGANILIIPLYFLSLGLSPLTIGEILSLSVLFGSFMGLAFSFLGDMYGRKRLSIINEGISVLALLFLYLKYPIAYIFTMNWGVQSLIPALMAEKSANFQRLIGLSQSLNILLSVLGSLLPIILTYREILLLEIFINLISIILLIPVKEKFRGERNSITIRSIKTVSKFVTEAITGLGAGLILPLMSLWFHLKFGINVSSMSPVFAISEISLALGSYLSVIIAERLGEVRTIVLFHSIAIALLFYLPFSPSFIIASVVYVIRNILMNMTSPVFQTMVLKLIPEDERGRASGIINFMSSIPRALGPTIGGYFFNIENLYLPFFMTGSLYSLSTILFFIFFSSSQQ